MRPVLVKAHAKINTFLSVGDLRPDGYHSISTEMRAIGLHDTVVLTPSDEPLVTCSMGVLDGEANLASKAVRLMSELAEVPPLHIHVEKRIPIQAGLGGGSSDAAAVLRALGMVLPGNAREFSPEFADIAAAIGSDVVFFASGLPRAFMTGRGETLSEALPPLPALHVAVAMPTFGMPTSRAYAMLDKLRESPHPNPPPGRGRELEEMHNDFDLVAPMGSRVLQGMLLSHGASAAHLCGSGAAVFGVFETETAAESAASRIAAEGFWTWAGSTVTEIEEPRWM